MRHLPVWLVIIPLFQSFLIPLIRVIEEHLQHSQTTRLFPCVKAFLAILLVIESVITGYLLVSFHGEWVYPMGGWRGPFGIPIVIDRLSLIFLFMINMGMIIVTVYSFSYPFQQETKYYTLLCTIRAAMVGLVISADLFNMYVLIELISIASTALISMRLSPRSIWGGFQYLVINSLAGLLIFLGIALLYGSYGVLSITEISSALAGGTLSPQSIWAIGLFLIGGLIKIALFPFNYWLPPAHGEAKLPVSSLLSGVLLQINFYFILRLFTSVFPYHPVLRHLTLVLSVFSIVIGHGGALFSKSAKHILAYSSIVNMGYAGLALGLSGPNQMITVVFILLQHFIGKLFAFLSLGTVQQGSRIHGLKLAYLRVGLILVLVSLSGLPPFPGFWSKWLLLQETALMGNPWLSWVVILSVYPSVIYYHRAYRKAISEQGTEAPELGWGAIIVVCAAVPAVLGLTVLFVQTLIGQGREIPLSFGKVFLELVIALGVMALYSETQRRYGKTSVKTSVKSFINERLRAKTMGLIPFSPFKTTLWLIFISVMILLFFSGYS